MKQLFYFLIPGFLVAGCNRSDSAGRRRLEDKIDSLQKTIAGAYKPGLGEFMSDIQLHHEKLWFAGKDRNWDLAAFEIGEIKEALDDIHTYCNDRPEVRFLPMINAPLDSLGGSIREKNTDSFKKNYIVLTNTCNSCHQATKHGFNVIKMPELSPFSDQEFSVAPQAGR